MSTSEGTQKNKSKKKDATRDSDENPKKGSAKATTHSTMGTMELDDAVIGSLKYLYKERLLPIEQKYLFQKFNYAEILDAELSAKPTILLVGQYSTGKTSFVKHIIGMDYPEIHIGPEPTTDRFIAVVHGEEEKIIKGNALTGFTELPFAGLSVFGSSFLNKFSAAMVPSKFLTEMNIIDTPGVLSGEKQRYSRGYDFAKVARWFAERSDLILLLFDCSKLDISDEFKSVIEELQPHEDKVHCVLNKADQLDTESLMRVYGALLWSMGRIFKGAEVTRIYVGSFHEGQYLRGEEHVKLFTKDRDSLFAHIQTLPKACSLRKINEMVKRIRLNIVHVCIISYLRAQMPMLWGKEKKQNELIINLKGIFDEVQRKYSLPAGDFPKVEDYASVLTLCDFQTFPVINRKMLEILQDLLMKDIPKITNLMATSSGPRRSKNTANKDGEDAEDDDDEGASASQQPQMFIYKDDSAGGASSSQQKMLQNLMFVGILVGVLLVIIAVIVMVILQDEDYKQVIMKFITELTSKKE